MSATAGVRSDRPRTAARRLHDASTRRRYGTTQELRATARRASFSNHPWWPRIWGHVYGQRSNACRGERADGHQAETVGRHASRRACQTSARRTRVRTRDPPPGVTRSGRNAAVTAAPRPSSCVADEIRDSSSCSDSRLPTVSANSWAACAGHRSAASDAICPLLPFVESNRACFRVRRRRPPMNGCRRKRPASRSRVYRWPETAQIELESVTKTRLPDSTSTS